MTTTEQDFPPPDIHSDLPSSLKYEVENAMAMTSDASGFTTLDNPIDPNLTSPSSEAPRPLKPPPSEAPRPLKPPPSEAPRPLEPPQPFVSPEIANKLTHENDELKKRVAELLRSKNDIVEANIIRTQFVQDLIQTHTEQGHTIEQLKRENERARKEMEMRTAAQNKDLEEEFANMQMRAENLERERNKLQSQYDKVKRSQKNETSETAQRSINVNNHARELLSVDDESVYERLYNQFVASGSSQHTPATDA